MTNRVEPALTPEEWRTRTITRAIFRVESRRLRGGRDLALAVGNVTNYPLDYSPPAFEHSVALRDDLPAVIALANDALPDDDPRKITQAHVDALRSVCRQNPDNLPGYGVPIQELADRLAALLPP